MTSTNKDLWKKKLSNPSVRALLKSELTPERQLRSTNKSHNEIYVVTAQNAPNVMKEIGRLREIAFRTAGGGTGKAMDIDEFDLMECGCKQLIVWNPEARRSSAATATSSARTGSSMPTDSPSWL